MNRSTPVTIFATTLWSVVRTAGQGEGDQSAAALEQLCRAYWYPLYAYARRQTSQPEEAQDLTQGFFAHLLDTKLVARADPDSGRFRSYLLVCFKNFIGQERQRAHTQKRGGGTVRLSIDAEDAEGRYRLEPADEQDAERIYERRWAITLIEQVLRRLEQDQRDAGKGALFECLQDFLVGEKDHATYSEVSVRTGLSEGALRVAVHRLRERYRVLFREEVAQTVCSQAELDEEMRHLFQVLSG